MFKISAWDQLAAALAAKKHNVAKSFTNFFPDREQFHILLREGRVSLLDSGSVLWITRRDRGFQHLYYSCPLPEDLDREFEQVLPCLTDVTTVTLVARQGSFENVEAVLFPLGFRLYSQFLRLSCPLTGKTDPRSGATGGISYAGEADAPQVEELFLSSFDPLDDEIPSLAEIKNYISLKEATVIRTPTELGGCLITLVNGKTSRFLYVAVSSHLRGQGLASALMRDYLRRCAEDGIQRSLLWVRDANENALAYYRHFGYTEDGLRKRIYLYRI